MFLIVLIIAKTRHASLISSARACAHVKITVYSMPLITRSPLSYSEHQHLFLFKFLFEI